LTHPSCLSKIYLSDRTASSAGSAQKFLTFISFNHIERSQPASEVKLKRNSASTVFSDLFSRPEYRLQLYHVFHPEDTDVTEDQLTNVTLSSILVTGIKTLLDLRSGADGSSWWKPSPPGPQTSRTDVLNIS
jgi:hypothetical protein